MLVVIIGDVAVYFVGDEWVEFLILVGIFGVVEVYVVVCVVDV